MIGRKRSRGADLVKRVRSGSRNGVVARIQRLRSETEVPSGDRLVLATLRIRIAEKTPWTGPFSRAHPGVILEVLNQSQLTEDVSVSDYWISGDPPGVWAREIAEYADVTKVDSLAEVGEGSMYRITYRNPPIVYLYRKLGLPIQFPLRIQDGSIRWEVAARRFEFEAVLQYARDVDPGFQVISIRRRPLRSHLPVLTTTQQELLSRAMAAGYFAVPRAITLTELARKLDRSKSAVSEAIAIIERKLLESAVQPTTMYSQ